MKFTDLKIETQARISVSFTRGDYFVNMMNLHAYPLPLAVGNVMMAGIFTKHLKSL